MVASQPEKTIRIQFRAMNSPIAIAVPTYMLRYLDMFADRTYNADGSIVYYQTGREALMAGFLPPKSRPTLLA